MKTENTVISHPDRQSAAGRKNAGRNADGTHMPVARLHRGHIAFMRAVVQGLDTRESWSRYLRGEGEHDDVRNVRRAVQWIRDEFAAAARRHGRHGIARLVRVDASQIPEKERAQASLEQFAADHGLLDFSEAEQLEAYQAHHGPVTSRQSRRSRLVAKQLDALFWLEGLVSHPPQADDPLHSWLNPDLAAHLGNAGIRTVRQLAERINGIGRRWHAGIAAIGSVKAARILDWMTANEAATGLALGRHIDRKRSALERHELDAIVPAATAVVPLEKLLMPAALDGSDGINRAQRAACSIDAANDREAIHAWIAAKGAGRAAPGGPRDGRFRPGELTSTQRAYFKEAERLMLWAILDRKKPLSSLTADDCATYLRFIAAPAPRERWCGPRGRERWSPLWRPFEGPLSQAAQRHAVVILKNLFGFLAGHAYLARNVWDTIALPARAASPLQPRGFTHEQWRFLTGRLEQLPATSACLRLKFAMRLFYATGLRLGEAVNAQVGHLAWASYPAGNENEQPVEGWQLLVEEKGGLPPRVVPVPAAIVDELRGYLGSRGLAPDVTARENHGAFLLGKAVDIAERAPWAATGQGVIDARDGIVPGTLYRQMKSFFADSAQALAANDTAGARHLEAASTHWLRHTCRMHALAAGTPSDLVRQNLGQVVLSGSAAHVRSEEKRRMRALQRHEASLHLDQDAQNDTGLARNG